jgi:hypothetical protein
VTLSNHTDRIHQVELAVEGIPHEWVEGASKPRHLPKVEQRDMDLVINVPRSPEGLAKTYSVTVAAHSLTVPEMNPGTAAATWTVEPFETSKLLLTPSKASGVLSANYNVALYNNGNRPLTYVLTGSDSDRRLEYVFSAEGYPSSNRFSIEVAPGEKTNVRLQVQSPKRWFGSTNPHNFTLQALPVEGKQESKMEGHFLHRAVFPTWAIAVAPILLIGLLMLVPWMMRPEVRTVYLEPLTPKPDETFTIYWDAPRAKRIRVFLNDVPVRPDPPADAGLLAFPNGIKKDSAIKVVASNLFGQAESPVTVQLAPAIPPAAAQLEASIDKQRVAPNEDVTISWSATKAERVEFSHKGSVGLTDQFTDHPTENQTYVVTAFNSAGAQVQKKFQVTVAKPGVERLKVRLTASSPDRKRDKQNFELNQGRYVFFDWDAPNATGARIEGGGQTVTLVGTSGRARRAQLRGKGHYTFRLIAMSESGEEVASQPVEIDVTCTAIQIATKRCNGTPEARW